MTGTFVVYLAHYVLARAVYGFAYGPVLLIGAVVLLVVLWFRRRR